jgi:hypothetical protein
MNKMWIGLSEYAAGDSRSKIAECGGRKKAARPSQELMHVEASPEERTAIPADTDMPAGIPSTASSQQVRAT